MGILLDKAPLFGGRKGPSFRMRRGPFLERGKVGGWGTLRIWSFSKNNC